MNDTQIQLLTLLNSYGDIIELDYEFDADQVISELNQLDYISAPNGKSGLNLTGPVDDLGLDAKDKHADNQSYNDNLLACPSLVSFFDLWENLARCRVVKMSSGSFFKLHRDAYRMNPQLRIFIPLNKTQIHEWCFIYGQEVANFKPGRAYILNTRKQHGSFAMTDDIYHVLMSVYLTENNLKTIIKLLPNCKEN